MFNIIYLLSLENEQETNELFDFADKVRREYMGEGILLRGIVEFSNFCRNTCLYCGINKDNKNIQRYKLTKGEILLSAARIASSGIKTVVLQSGENDDFDLDWMLDVVKEIKKLFGLAITLSLGERTYEEFKALREAGADRYLLKIETSNKNLYEAFHPNMSFENRILCLKQLKDLGYQVGSGIIIGLNGQTIEHIAEDLLFLKDNDFDMIGIGPFIPQNDTQLKDIPSGDKILTLKTIALARILTKNSHIPATTALGSLARDFRPEGLKAGANVLMPNFTPQPYKKYYEIYSGKKCIDEPLGSCAGCMEHMAVSVGRSIDYSIGDTKKAMQNV